MQRFIALDLKLQYNNYIKEYIMG